MQDVRAKTLQRAAEILGGELSLAFRLRVTPSHLALWISGVEAPRDGAFLGAVDIVLEQDTKATQGLPNTRAKPELTD